MEENNKEGMNPREEKTLRTRRPRISSRPAEGGKAYSTADWKGRDDNQRQDRQSYGERRSYGSYERRSYSSGRSYGEGGYNRGSQGGYNRDGGSNGGYNRSGNGYSRDGGNSSYSRGSYNRDNNGYGRSEGGYQRNSNYRSSYHNNGSSEEGEHRSYSRGYGEGSYNRAGQGNHNNHHEGNGVYSQNRSGYNRDGGSNGGYNRGGFNRQGGPNRGYKKPGFAAAGGKKKVAKKPKYGFTDDSGIDMMIAKRPLVSQTEWSDNDLVAPPIKEEVRLNKFIANSGVCSRREADQYIQAGVVTVNGEVVTELGTKINVLKDEIKFNGERLHGEEKVYIVMNKPKGYVTTASDPHAEKTVMGLMKDCTARVFPVGRLDKTTTGVLMFTNDGEIAEKLTHPSYDKKKIYQVILDHELSQEDFEKVTTGITLSDGDIKADDLEYIDAQDKRKVGIEIHSGKNRIVRRIFEALGYEVKALDRVYFAGLTKKGLKKGQWRYLSDGEVNVLKMGAYV